MRADRGATEVLGYVLVIALVTATIAVVMTTGISGLYASQEAEQVNNMERAFDVLAHNVEEIVHRGAPSRSTELRLADGSVRYDERVEIDVTQNGERIENLTIGTQPISYESGMDTQIVYEGGAVIRTDGNHSVMLRPPPFVIEEDHILINGVRTRALSGSLRTIDRKGTALIRKESLGSTVGTADGGDGNVTITVNSSRADAWARYFEEQDIGEVVTAESDRTVYELDVDEIDGAKIYVVRSRVRVTLVD